MDQAETTPQDAQAALRERMRFYRELGIGEFYRRPVDESAWAQPEAAPEARQAAAQATPAAAAPNRAWQQESAPLIPSLPEEYDMAARKPFPAPPAIADPLPPEQHAGGLQIIRDDIGDCTRCGLAAGRNKLVFGDGDPNARLMFVGEGPGADEDAQGIPFVGRAGQLLTQMIENTAAKEGIPLKRPDVYICNVVKCRPPENRNPEPDEMEICGQFLFRQLSVIQPKAICALGSTAAKALLGGKEGVTKLRGKWLKWRDIPLIVTYHPSYLLRAYNVDAKREAWEDLKKVLHFVYD